MNKIDEMDRWITDVFGSLPFPTPWRQVPGKPKAWEPRVEILEREADYIIRAELPGAKKDDIDVSVSGNTLTIQGERKAPKELEGEYHRCETCYGTFCRSLVLPAGVDTEKIEAAYENGMLQVRLPKMSEAVTKKVQITSKSG